MRSPSSIATAAVVGVGLLLLGHVSIALFEVEAVLTAYSSLAGLAALTALQVEHLFAFGRLAEWRGWPPQLTWVAAATLLILFFVALLATGPVE